MATTPEGFRATYRKWVRDAKAEYALYRAPTLSNPYLPADYVDGLRQTYPPNLLSAYIEGQFVNLNSGAVYPDFDRQLNGCDTLIQPFEPIDAGVDFNVYNCTAILYVQRGDEYHAVGELTGVRDTPTLARMLVERFPDNPVTVYPDASGQGHKSVNAALSDLAILKAVSLTVRANGTNPAVRDRRPR
ncbi:hypothetical protein [Paludibacterium denitrificans]|uniref:hypothetical protein n=1 Tax=Paludibacterium denitrificans TaxID=2675226 RepID=UPI001E43A6F4|nr:hypothetical protein [Paludibacterium denitrificans]